MAIVRILHPHSLFGSCVSIEHNSKSERIHRKAKEVVEGVTAEHCETVRGRASFSPLTFEMEKYIYSSVN